jgi:hypothetical protein
MEIKHPAKLNYLKTPMKNLLVKLLPLLAIVIATPAFAGTNDEDRDRSNRQVSYGENRDFHDRSHTVKHRDGYVKVKVVTPKNYSPRVSRLKIRREVGRYSEYRGYRQVRGNRDNYFYR